jgi:hypothetical protein
MEGQDDKPLRQVVTNNPSSNETGQQQTSVELELEEHDIIEDESSQKLVTSSPQNTAPDSSVPRKSSVFRLLPRSMILPQLKVHGWTCIYLLTTLLLLTLLTYLSHLLFSLLSSILPSTIAYLISLSLLYYLCHTLISIPVFAGSFWFLSYSNQVRSCTSAASHLHWELVQF